jgi:hypothetical protein
VLVHRREFTLRNRHDDDQDASNMPRDHRTVHEFEDCLAIVPCDTPSKLFLERIAQFRVTAPCAEWNGVRSLVEK